MSLYLSIGLGWFLTLHEKGYGLASQKAIGGNGAISFQYVSVLQVNSYCSYCIVFHVQLGEMAVMTLNSVGISTGMMGMIGYPQ